MNQIKIFANLLQAKKMNKKGVSWMIYVFVGIVIALLYVLIIAKVLPAVIPN